MENNMRNVVVLTVFLLLGFSAHAAKFTGTLQKVAETGVFTIGYNTDSAPFSFQDKAGLPTGYSVDLCRRIATATREKLGLKEMEVKFVEITLESRFDAVESGKIDIECSSSTITLSRLEKVDFTLMTFVTGGSLVSMADAAVVTTADISGKTVAVTRGTTTEIALKAYLKESLIDASIVMVDTDSEGMGLLDDDTVQAFASDQVVLIGQIVNSPDPESYTLSEDIFSFEPYGLSLRRNDADFRLVANRSLAQIYRTGQFKALFNKWFGKVGLRPSPVLAAMYQLEALPE
jgi:ABC-type amino acid transport substrate-binding protein